MLNATEVSCSQGAPDVVYKPCPGFRASYVGQTVRHVQRRVREHLRSNGIMKTHFQKCNVDLLPINVNDILTILDKYENFQN